MKEQALEYHKQKPPGKVATVPTKPCRNVKDLTLAYSPGVAHPCLEIEKNPDLAYEYTSRGNVVAVISDGTAVLGLGDIGPLASKPVMEGKGVLFKRFAGVDVFDLEIDEKDPHKFIDIVKALEPTFGGLNLEDIKAPECFLIEEELSKRMNIPVFHDDQHGTAVITLAALINALKISNKKIEDIKVVFSGAGAAAIAIAKLALDMGLTKENIWMFDSKGLITKDREVNPYKAQFAQSESVPLTDALNGADVFIGVSKADLLTKEMVQSMNEPPIVFAMANPNPEIAYPLAKEANPNTIMATGRSDYPNQVNNVLCFPFLFRGALDVRATAITKNMKIAAVHALASLAHEPVPQVVKDAYNREFSFGADYIIPTPFDPRVLVKMASAVAKAAMEDGVAQKPMQDFATYEAELAKLGDQLANGDFIKK